MPNVLITGTPGVGVYTTLYSRVRCNTELTVLGKSALAQALVQRDPSLHLVDVGKEVVEKGLHEGRDEEWDCLIIDEDKIVDELEPVMAARNNVVDYHSCDFFPERWFDLVVVLRTDNEVLYPRLEKRKYPENKITENISAEIMQVVLEEALESYKAEIVWELSSNTLEEMDRNTDKIMSWIKDWNRSHNTHKS
eukprot:TRINITY_DN6662_c0_g1_i1.p1 TRINITY_DN6662_c0_g1~~TRINITY_DN6662_c0_g1_i1.p1  ORF type:complete len:204 (-),score=55.53 TRINITY_DN6662_c0_g1_i1:146-727(-)